MLVLDAGDSLVGDQNPALKTKGQTSIAAMNMMTYTAMALGPKDLGLGVTVLNQRMAEARFAILSANAVVSATGQLVAKPYVIQELGGHKVAIIGLSAVVKSPEIVVRDPLATAQTVVAEVSKQADVIILLSHAGATVDQQIADNVRGIDLIVSGDKPALAAPWLSKTTNTPVVRADTALAGHAGRIIGIARLSFDAQGNLVNQKWERVELSPSISDDPTMSAWVRQQLAR